MNKKHCKGRYILATMLLCMFFSFELLAQNVKFSFKNTPIKTILVEISEQTGFKFIYSNALDAVNNSINFEMSADKKDIGGILQRLFTGQGVSWKIEGNQVVIAPSEIISAASKANNAKRTVKGKVTDEKGETIPGVAIKNKSTGAVAVSDIDGNYTIEANQNDILLFSFVGMKDCSEKVEERDTINVSMYTDLMVLEDVIVTGYQTISKERSTGSFAKVTTEKLESKRLSSLSSLLEGEVPGLHNGLLRGVTSMKGNTSPLYVIDGFPVENTQYSPLGYIEEFVPELNIDDIESITILKDAAATSIYGARAANGVIVIETKKATSNKTRVSFNGTLSIKPHSIYTGNIADAETVIGLEREWAETSANLNNPTTGKQYAQSLLDNAAYPSGGIKTMLNYYAGNISQSEMEQQLGNYISKGYSYLRDIEKYGCRNQFLQQYNVNVSRGNDKNSFRASFSYKRDQLEDKYSNKQSFGLNFSNTTQIAPWLQLDLGNYTNYGKGKTQTYSLTSPGYEWSIYDSLVNPDGSNFTKKMEDIYSVSDMATIHKYNLLNMDVTPLDEIGFNVQEQNNIANRSYIKLNASLTKWLKYSASFQYEYARYETSKIGEKESFITKNFVNQFVDNNGVFNLPHGDTYYEYSNTTHGYSLRHQLDFNKTIKEKHNIIALAGMEVRENKVMYCNKPTLYGYDPDMLSYSAINANDFLNFYDGVWGFGSINNGNLRELLNRYVSLYANAAYSYNTKYILTGSVRWDRSNLWSTGSKYQDKPSWSVGLSWNIDREDFLSNINWINMLKLRTSYGIGGNVAKDAAPYIVASYYQNSNVGGLEGYISARPNYNLSWEITKTFNLGVDFSLLNNRLSGSLEYYSKCGKNLLANVNGVPTEGDGYNEYSINNSECLIEV